MGKQHNISNQVQHFCQQAFILLALLMTSISGAKAQDLYVIHNGDNYLSHNATTGAVNTTRVTTFDPTTCFWTINNSTLRPVNTTGGVLGNLYLRPRSADNTYSLNTNTSTNYNAWSAGLSDGGQPYYSTRWWGGATYYLSLNGTTWQVANTNSNRGTLRQVTVTSVASTSTNPTINGADVITATGNTTYTVTGAAYQAGGYTNYRFNNTDHYFNGNTVFTPVAATIGSYSWSLGSNSYATVNSTTGVVTVNSLPENDVTLTLTVTATVTGGTPAAPAGTTLTASKEITIQVLHEISSLSEITNPDGNYRLTGDATGTPSVATFRGTLDGGYYTISGLSAPLFTTLNGGTVKNVRFKDVSISGETVGAVCGTATGSAKIYNCGVLSGSVSGSTNAGGLVGLIASGSNVRVVNCYNYASVSGGDYAAGIVGRNQGTISGNTTVNTTGVRITNCMMYGDLTSGTNRSPVYGGNHTNNVQRLTEYNYYRSRANLTYTAYNDQLAIDKDVFLTRFPFYRHIQNTHRELAAYFLFGQEPTDAQVSEIGHWVLNTDVAPYPIIEEWKTNTKKTTVDKAANLPLTSNNYEGKQLTEMGNGGNLRVNVSINGSSFSCDLPITDMDTLRYDFTWGKVVLPFANEFEGWTRDYSKICTGWKITSVSGGTTGSLQNYNFADRDCTAKDIYNATTNPYIFAQGGNYIVPYGVTSISIEANFANAFYLSDARADFGYNNTYGGQTDLAYQVPTTYHGQRVYTNLSTLVGAMANSTNPHSQAIVLVGNFHYNQNTIGGVTFNTDKACTIMSVDEDNNQEPDYGWYSFHTTDRSPIPPIRFDFVPNIGMGMAERVTGSTRYPTIGIWHGRGWFELTETCVSFMSECEINDGGFTNNDNGYGNNRWIANSGYFIQIVRARSGDASKLSYLQIGGNAYVEELYPGSHTDNELTTTIRPIVVTGGEIEECYMTGYRAGARATGANIYFWGAGGRIHKWLGAYMENPNTNGVNVTAKIDHARIYKFFGGGTSASARITGNIDITMNNSFVDFYCGGPEFGDMAAGKTVTTHAKGSTFGEYYGAGFGGTSITYNREGNITNVNFDNSIDFPIAFGTTYKRLTNNATYGIGSCYKFEFILYSGGVGTGVARSYTGYAKFDLATTGSVTNELEGCTVKGNYYGAGCQGKVNGSVTSKLTGCTFEGSVFGGGFKATSNTLDVYPATEPTPSRYTKETGLFSDFGTVAPETFTWQYRATTGSDDGQKILYTNTDMTELGNVTGAISLTVDGGTVAGNVYGGGNESPSRNNTEVTINGTAAVSGDVYGGGNIANVDGTTSVGIQGGTISKDVYGGGALAHTNTKGGTTSVNLVGGTVHDVYGGGLGQKTGFNGATKDIEAYVYGNVTVTLNGSKEEGATNDCKVTGNIFGCNNLNGSPKGNVVVNIIKTVGYDDAHKKSTNKDNTTYDVAAVYGGGNMAAYVPNNPENPEAKAIVNIYGCDETSIQYVYGGGNAASVPASEVTVRGCYEIGYVFGGGNGKDKLPNGQDNPGANVGYYTYEYNGQTGVTSGTPESYGTGVAAVNLLGGRTHSAFGGSNTKGNVRSAAVAFLHEAKVSCPLSIDDVYGGGNEAYMEGNAQIKLGCITSLAVIYGGSKRANVGGDIVLNITSGHFDRIFGGNNESGLINGSITVNIEETGCHPITIGELYGCGNQAPYITPTGKADPTVNVKSFTSIGRIFGGGLGEGAVVEGNPTVNINEVVGVRASYSPWEYPGKTITFNEGDVTLPEHTAGAIGVIGEVFGGGNAADVVGNTTVNIGTAETVDYVSAAEKGIKVEGANILGNVYGGGNNANVSGKASVVVGRN
ncbi:MAG: ZmpA/ZmpB/ZmpC family metallo-endopeptidase-related protein [Bacteroidaceae bacterium]|nr:ZmpA/ZmpB/ZmpC family metallo-endopeptidase-related protein [Bacteroidaceae bacterium]